MVKESKLHFGSSGRRNLFASKELHKNATMQSIKVNYHDLEAPDRLLRLLMSFRFFKVVKVVKVVKFDEKATTNVKYQGQQCQTRSSKPGYKEVEHSHATSNAKYQGQQCQPKAIPHLSSPASHLNIQSSKHHTIQMGPAECA